MSSLYEVSSIFTLIMSKPNILSQILGILTRGTQIEVSSFSGSWACFNYKNTTAYVRKNSLNFINNTPTVKTGSVIIKYLDSETNDDIYTSKTINNLSMGTYSYEAQNVSGYKLTTNSPQSITLSENSPNATITFYYTKILCSITIRYVDENTEIDISNSQVIDNLNLGTYTYSYIEISGYKLDDTETETKTITFTENNTDVTIIFKYKEILGSIVINYIDNSSSTALLEPETISNLKLGNYTYSSKYISGYSIANSPTQTVSLTSDNPNAEISFKYYKLYGTVTLQYIDSSSNAKLSADEVYSNLEFGSYSYTAKSISGYKLSSNQTENVTINDNNLNAIVIFYYTKILGSITIKYLDKVSLTELSGETILSNLELGSYTFDAIHINGYSAYGDSSKTIVLTDDNPNVEIDFMYSEILGSITVNYLDENNNKIFNSKIDNNLRLGDYTYPAISISGYKINSENSMTITLTEDDKDKTINFIYNKILGKITIKYLVKDGGAILHEAVVYSDLSLGIYSYDALTFDRYTSLESPQTVTLTEENLDIVVNFEYEKAEIDIPSDLNINEVPYISTYYIKPIVKPGEEVFIDYYITDYYYKEYMEKYNLKEDTWGDDNWTEDIWNNEIFTVTVRVEGQPDRLYTGLKAGDHKVSLGSFSTEGEQKFSIVCTDKYNRSSHELFNFFLVQGEVEIKEYVMTENDLATYNIKNNDYYEEKIYVKVDSLTDTTTGTKIEEVANATVVPSHKYICFIGTTEEDENGNPIMQTTAARFWLNTIVKYADDYDKDAVLAESTNTRIGLQKLLDDKKAEGYNKLLLLPGKYRIDNNGTIYVPTEFTLDMNNSTLKENQFTGNKSLMISLDGTFNSHVINGIIEGDYFSHDYANSTNNSEWVNALGMSECYYCSYENLQLTDITGYGCATGRGEQHYNVEYIGSTTLGDIDRVTGSTIDSTIRTTSDFAYLGDNYKSNYIIISRYLGYQGRSGDCWNIIIHFYDENKNYIKSIDGYQYRRIRVPNNSSYIKVTLLSTTISSDLSIYYMCGPCHCNISNIKFNNIRCVGLAQSAMNDMLVSANKFINCGQSSAKCAYDAEDGWDMMQDTTFKNNTFSNNPNNDFLTCAGHNFIVDGQQGGKIYIWSRTRSLVVKNCNNVNITLQGGGIKNIIGHGIYRIFNNVFSKGNVVDNLSKNNIVIEGLGGVVYNSILGSLGINNYGISGSIYNNCTIKPYNKFLGYVSNITMINCNLNPNNSFNTEYYFVLSNSSNNTRLFENCKFYGNYSLNVSGGTSSITYTTFKNCYFENSHVTIDTLRLKKGDLTLFENCKFNYKSNYFIYVSPNAYDSGYFDTVKFDSCIIKNTDDTDKSFIYCYAKPNGEFIFNNCIISILSTIIILDAYESNSDKITDLTITFNNSPIPENIKLISDYLKDNSNIKFNILK